MPANANQDEPDLPLTNMPFRQATHCRGPLYVKSSVMGFLHSFLLLLAYAPSSSPIKITVMSHPVMGRARIRKPLQMRSGLLQS